MLMLILLIYPGLQLIGLIMVRKSHKSELGRKCGNRGGALKEVEEAIKEAVETYRDDILNNIDRSYDDEMAIIEAKVKQKQAKQKKFEDAIVRVNDSYDLGDYSRE